MPRIAVLSPQPFPLCAPGLTDWHYHDPTNRAVAEAIWRITDQNIYPEQPRSIDRANVITELRRTGHWEVDVHPEDLKRLDRHGTIDVVNAAPQYAEVIIEAAVARALAEEFASAAEQVLKNPQDARSLHTNLVDVTGRVLARVDKGADYSIQAVNQQYELRMTPGIYTGIPFIDATVMGLNEAEIIGIQGRQKSGKTRFYLMLLLRVLRAGIPTVIFTTDDTTEILRNRLVSLIGTAWLSQPVYADTTDDEAIDRLIERGGRAPRRGPDGRVLLRDHRAPREEWRLNPRRLDLSPRSRLTPLQKQACEYALTVINEKMRLYVLDTSAGIQDFQTLHDQLQRHLRPPFNCQLWVVDHLADLSHRGVQDFATFRHAMVTLKTLNNALRLTGVAVNQRNEGGNRDAGKQGSFGSYMGGPFAASIAHLIELNDGKTDEYVAGIKRRPGWEWVTADDLSLMHLRTSRWTGAESWTWLIDQDSGLFLNMDSYPQHLHHLVNDLPYRHNPRDPESWRH